MDGGTQVSRDGDLVVRVGGQSSDDLCRLDADWFDLWVANFTVVSQPLHLHLQHV